MKATIATKDLRDALKKVKPIKWNKQLPILSNALVEFTDGKTRITTNDLSRTITVEIESKVDSPFTVVLPYRTTEIFLCGANGNITIVNDPTTNPNQLIVEREGLGQVNLDYLHKPEDFPKITLPDNLTWYSIDAKWFCHMLDILLSACGKEISRPILEGICCKEGSMASADGFRLVSLRDDRLTFGLNDKEAIIPSATALLVRRVFRTETTLEVAFEITEQQTIPRVHFKSKGISIDSEVILGRYPNWEQLIPATYNFKASFSAPLMLQRLNMIDSIIYAGITRLSFQKSKDKKEHQCLITALAEEECKYSLMLPVKIETEDEGKIAFNVVYLKDLLKYFSLCTLELTSMSSPGKFTGDIEGLTIVVMPMFVQW